MKLLLIRHGESQADLMDVHEGRADFELTARGHRQAEAMARRVAGEYRLSAIYSSPLKRARQTAQALAGQTGLDIIFDDLLMEFDNGLLAGMDRAEAQRIYPRVPDLPPHMALYGQESALAFRYRAERALSKLISGRGEEETIACLSHGGMISQLIRSLLRLPQDSDARFLTGDTGIHEWRINGTERRMIFANSTAHISF